MIDNIDDPTPLHTLDGTYLEWKDDFKYLGSWVDNSEKDISIRKAQAWRALNGMMKIWKSNMSKDLKIRFFISNKIASRRLQLAGHCYRHPELNTQKLVLWVPTHGHRGRGRPITTYIDTLKRDTGAFEASEITVLMADKRLWKDLVVACLRATK